jgi:hypothetical protein
LSCRWIAGCIIQECPGLGSDLEAPFVSGCIESCDPSNANWALGYSCPELVSLFRNNDPAFADSCDGIVPPKTCPGPDLCTPYAAKATACILEHCSGHGDPYGSGIKQILFDYCTADENCPHPQLVETLLSPNQTCESPAFQRLGLDPPFVELCSGAVDVSPDEIEGVCRSLLACPGAEGIGDLDRCTVILVVMEEAAERVRCLADAPDCKAMGACFQESGEDSAPAMAFSSLVESGFPTALKTGDLFDDMAPPLRFRILVEPDDWAWLQANPTLEQYVPARVEFEGRIHESAALRFKGAYGTLHACFMQGFEPCRKLSMKVSFNKYQDEGRFHGVRKLIFNSCLRDDSCLRERLSYATFRDAGIKAPRAVHAIVSVNDEPESLFLLVEEVDKEFLEDHFTDSTGNLYKEAWPRLPDSNHYRALLRTNRTEGNVDRLVELSGLLQDLDEERFGDVIEPWMDLDLMARYLAVDLAILNWDGIRQFYCGSGYCGNHNFFLYDDPASRRFVVIPWDLDNTIQSPNRDMGRSAWNDGPDVCEIQPISWLAGVLAPQCDPLMKGLLRWNWPAVMDAMAALSTSGGPLDPARQQALLDRYRAMILAPVAADPKGPSLSRWRMDAAVLREIVAAQGIETRAILDWIPGK